MSPNCIRFPIFLLAVISSAISFAQEKLSEKPTFIAINSMYGAFQVHTPKINKYRGVNPYAFELEWSRWYLTEKAHEKSGTFSKLTVSAGYTHFNHPDLGYALQSMVSIEPFLVIRPKFRMSVTGGVGVSYLSKVYDAQLNPDNLIFSTHMAFPLRVGTVLYYLIQPRLGLKTELAFRHISNGGVSQPNLGINYYALNLGLEYSLNTYQLPVKNKDVEWQKINRFDVVAGYTQKEDTSYVNNKSVATIMGQHFWQKSRIHGITTGFMIDYQEATKTGEKPLSMGIFFGNEFLIGQFRFGQQMGLYLIKGTQARNLLFQNYYLRWLSRKQLSVGVHMKAHGHVADYLALQVGYYWGE